MRIIDAEYGGGTAEKILTDAHNARSTAVVLPSEAVSYHASSRKSVEVVANGEARLGPA